ncbi:MAG: tetratricopeptide repeat protein [bacterium]|nr:tetratricopeptide repeat protein [bacterium]
MIEPSARNHFLILALAAALLAIVPAHGLLAQAGDELAELERMAEDSFAEDDLETAIALYRQVADRMPALEEKTRIRMTVAYLEHLDGRASASLSTVTAALVANPRTTFQPELYDDSFREVFYEGQKRAVVQRENLAEEAIGRGNEQLGKRDYPAARQHFEAALSYRPGHPTALYNLALVYLYEKRPEEAEAGFQKLLALGDAVDPKIRSLGMTNLGYLYQRRGQDLEAEEVLQQAVALDPGNARAWSILGASRRQMGKLSAAADAHRRAYELSPGDPQAMSHLAVAYIDAERWDDAVALLEKATAADPERPSLWLHLGLARLGRGNSTGAVAAFEAAIRLDPANSGGQAANATMQLAGHYYQSRQYQQALQQADRALGWDSGLVNAHIYQGLAKESLGDLTGARESLEEALRLDPARAATHNNLGSVYYQLGLYDQAEESLKQALSMQPDFPDARANLDAVQQARSRPRQAAPPPSSKGRSNGKTAPPTRGPRLRIRFADIDYAALGLKGAMVERVEPGGPASRAGLQKNDLILKADGRDVTDADALRRYVASKRTGSTVTLSLLRANVPMRVDVRLN